MQKCRWEKKPTLGEEYFHNFYTIKVGNGEGQKNPFKMMQKLYTIVKSAILSSWVTLMPQYWFGIHKGFLHRVLNLKKEVNKSWWHYIVLGYKCNLSGKVGEWESSNQSPVTLFRINPNPVMDAYYIILS